MRLKKVATIADRIAAQVGRVTGLGMPSDIYLSTSKQTQIAETTGTNIALNPEWLKNASRREIKGVLAHELTHAAGTVANSKTNEAFADAVRARLGYGDGKGYNSVLENRFDSLNREGFQNIASSLHGGNYTKQQLQNQEDRNMANRSTGPKSGDGRIRNTLANTLSKNQINYSNPGGAQALPALSPASTANYYSQLGNLYSGYQVTLASLRQQRLGLKANAVMARSQVRGQLTSGLAQVQNDAIERGSLGSSAQLQQEGAVRGEASATRAGIRNDLNQGLGQLAIQKAQAAVQLNQGVSSLEAQKLAEQQSALADQLQNNLIISGQETQMDALKAIYQAQMNALQGGGGGGQGGGGGNGSDFNYVEWRRRQAKAGGFDNVGDLERFIFAGKTGL